MHDVEILGRYRCTLQNSRRTTHNDEFYIRLKQLHQERVEISR